MRPGFLSHAIPDNNGLNRFSTIPSIQEMMTHLRFQIATDLRMPIAKIFFKGPKLSKGLKFGSKFNIPKRSFIPNARVIKSSLAFYPANT